MIRMLKGLCTTALALQLCACAHTPSKPVRHVTLDADLQKITTYQELADNTALSTVSLRVNQSYENVDERESLRRQFAAILVSDATLDAKRFVCRQLALIGTSEDVPTLDRAMQDQQLTEMARYALERIPGPAADKALVRALENARGDARIGIVNSLGNRRTTMATRALIAELDSGTTESATFAAALSKIGTPHAIGAIATARSQADPKLRQGLTAALLNGADGLAVNGYKTKAANIYQELLSPQEPIFINVAALRGMVVIQPEQALPLVAKAIESDSPEMRVCAMRFIRQISGEQATQVFVGKLDRVSPSTRVLLIEALADRGDRTALPAIIAQIKDKNPEVRRAALAALGKLGDDAIAPLLVEKVASETGEIQEAACKSLTQLRGEDVDTKLIAALDEVPPDQQAKLIAILGARGAKSALAVLVKLLQEAEGAVRREAFNTLGLIGGRDELTPVVHALATQDKERSTAEKAALAIVKRMNDNPAASRLVLTECQATSNPEDQAALMGTLAGIGGADALKAVRTNLESKKPVLRDAAVRALSDWSNTSPMEDLQRIAKTTKEPVHQVLALQGFMRMAALKPGLADAERVQLFTEALNLAHRPDEKWLALAGLDDIEDPTALALAMQYIDETEIKAEAQSAALKIAAAIQATHPEAAKAAADKVLQAAANDDLRKQAQELHSK